MKSCCLINPRSGGGRGIHLYNQFKSTKGIFDSIILLDFSQIEKQLDKLSSYDTVIVAGGDGTIGSVAKILCGSSVKIGILPLGTANDLAREIGIPRSICKKDAATLHKFFTESCTPKPLCLWEFSLDNNPTNSKVFLNYLSIGFDAKVVHDFSQRRVFRSLPGSIGVALNRFHYGLSGIRNLYSPTYPFQINNVETPKKYKTIIFANIQSYMGIARSNFVSDPFDNKLECVVAENISDYFTMMLSSLGVSPTSLSLLNQATTFELCALPVGLTIQIDGEAVSIEPKYNRALIEPYGSVELLVPTSL